jgi:hypothetical protein
MCRGDTLPSSVRRAAVAAAICVVIAVVLALATARLRQSSAARHSTVPSAAAPLAAESARNSADIIVYPPFDENEDGSLPVEYELKQPLAQAEMQIFVGARMVARVPLSDVSAGRHRVVVPGPVPFADSDPPIFSCNFPDASGSGITMFRERLYESGSDEPDDSAYAYRPDPEHKNYADEPLDEASAFRGNEVGISGMIVPYRRNRERRDRNLPPEIEILGVGFTEGKTMRCSKDDMRAETEVRNVKVVSTLSHESNPDMPELRAGTFTVPPLIADPVNRIIIVGQPK